MKSKLFLAIAIFIAVGIIAGIAVFISKTRKGETDGDKIQDIAESWIDVLKPAAFELAEENGEKSRELRTGDELNPNSIIQTNESGFANVYLVNGSVIRLDSGTKFILEENTLDSRSGKSVIKINLLAGRLWSKIFELATPDSLWEVKTSNTVATVRGTAFGVEYVNGKTTVIGSENKIDVFIIDPLSGKIVDEVKAVVSAGEFIEIKNEDIKKIKEDKTALAAMVKASPKELLEQKWIHRAEQADVEYNKKIEEIKEKDIETSDIKKEIFQFFQSPSKGSGASGQAEQSKQSNQPESPQSRIKSEEPRIESGAELNSEAVIPLPNNEETIKTVQTPISAQTPAPVPKEFILETKNSLEKITEGEKIIFKAFLVMNNGEKKDVTNEAVWQVLGPIGKIEAPGIFIPQLDVSVAELGENFGTVVATWKDKTGKFIFFAKSPILNVKAKAEEIIDRRG